MSNTRKEGYYWVQLHNSNIRQISKYRSDGLWSIFEFTNRFKDSYFSYISADPIPMERESVSEQNYRNLQLQAHNEELRKVSNNLRDALNKAKESSHKAAESFFEVINAMQDKTNEQPKDLPSVEEIEKIMLREYNCYCDPPHDTIPALTIGWATKLAYDLLRQHTINSGNGRGYRRESKCFYNY